VDSGLQPQRQMAGSEEVSADGLVWTFRLPNKAALDHVIYAPLGLFLRLFARRKNLAGIGRAPLPLPWGVSKTA
jgi:hypothetical protein